MVTRQSTTGKRGQSGRCRHHSRDFRNSLPKHLRTATAQPITTCSFLFPGTEARSRIKSNQGEADEPKDFHCAHAGKGKVDQFFTMPEVALFPSLASRTDCLRGLSCSIDDESESRRLFPSDCVLESPRSDASPKPIDEPPTFARPEPVCDPAKADFTGIIPTDRHKLGKVHRGGARHGKGGIARGLRNLLCAPMMEAHAEVYWGKGESRFITARYLTDGNLHSVLVYFSLHRSIHESCRREIDLLSGSKTQTVDARESSPRTKDQFTIGYDKLDNYYPYRLRSIV
jgi:hypothetical protein